MDEALRIHDYLPISYANREEEAYIRFLWDAFETNTMPKNMSLPISHSIFST